MNSKNRNIILVVAIICFGLLLVGGTYAFLTFTANVTNATYNATSTCFLIDYDTGEAITGTLFQSSTPKGGLSGSVTMNINENCSVAGNGTITLNVGTDTDSLLLSEGALKYSVYEYIDEDPVASGTITKTGDLNVYEGFTLPMKYAKTYYIYIWLDGTIADNDYIDVAFSGHVKASATQSNDCVITYVNEITHDDVWTQTIIDGQPFTLPAMSEKGYYTYSRDGDIFECYYNSGSVTLSCGTVLVGSKDLCWG